ncbi:hypothetical protein R1flu_026218 [Riccia fluitans]|uniref:PGG domain-containing protein n=1 Tax=Riccia fluitans TaxID=41844 RepID=A0ABD1XFT5_9MARC
MQGAGTNVSSSTFESLKKRLLQVVGDKDRTRQIVTEYPLSEIPHNEYIDTELQLNILHIVAIAGDLDSVKELRSQGCADPTARTVGGLTAVHLAASRGHTEVVKKLVNWLQSNTGARVSDHGFTPLHLATYKGHSETVEFLLADHHFSDVNAQDEIFGRTALHFAVLAGHATIVEMLMGVRGVNVRLTDRVRKLTPLLLAAMHPRDEDGSRLRMVKMLLDKNDEQINDKVGVFTDVSGFFTESLQKLTLIECEHDNSVKPVPDVNANADENQIDAYQRCAVPMDGHTALHLAATQNNAKLVSELSCRPGVSLNIPDTEFGMTPLHCAIRVGALQTFKVLMAIDSVNVNAQLVEGGPCQRPSWLLPPESAFSLLSYYDGLVAFVKSWSSLDTPLHLAIQVCRSEDLSAMVVYFINHPKFNGALHNDGQATSLEHAWIRFGYCSCLPSVFMTRRKVSEDPQVQIVENYLYEEKVHLANAIELLERHPTNASVLAQKEGTRKAAQDSLNTFLVTATLLAGLTFSAYLQPPIGTDDEVITRKSVKLFWVFNSLSFFSAVYTILTSLRDTIQTDDLYVKKSAYVGYVRIVGAVPLTLSVGFGIIAFLAAGYANVPSDSKQLMRACTIGGLLMVLFQLLQNLRLSYSQLRESLSLDVGYTLKDDGDLLLIITVFPALLLTVNMLQFCCVGKKIKTLRGRKTEREYIWNSPIPHICIGAAVILYALVEIF